MDDAVFDRWTRILAGPLPRRRLRELAAGAGILATLGHVIASDEVEGKRKKKKKKKKKRGGDCVRESTETTCAGAQGCELRPNNCGQEVFCNACPNGDECLPNESCANLCLDSSDCPSECTCFEEVEGFSYCLALVFSDSECAAQPDCDDTRDCPADHLCVRAACGSEGSARNRCWPLCNS